MTIQALSKMISLAHWHWRPFFLRALMLLLLASKAAPVSAQNAAGEASQEQAVSSLLLICIYYGHWPEPLDWRSNRVVRIGCLGKTTLDKTFNKVAADFKSQRFKDGAITFTNSFNPADLADCHVVYIADTSSATIRKAIDALGRKPILLVSAAKDFAEQGGTIQVFMEPGEQFQWDLNLDHLATVKIAVSSKMKERARNLIQNGRKIPIPARKGTAP